MESQPEKLKRAIKYGYGTGHIMNDMCTSLLYSYQLLYYERVMKLGSFHAGLILLVGQIADGIATVLVGNLSDRETISTLCLKYGKRKVFISC